MDDSEADGVITTKMSNGQLVLHGIFEDKNEIGAGGCDLNLQGCLSYMKYWSMDEVRVHLPCSFYAQSTCLPQLEDARKMCCCPSFVITAPGPWIAVLGTVLCDAGWVVQPLTDLVNLQFDLYNTSCMLDITCLFLALRESLKELHAFYQEIEK